MHGATLLSFLQHTCYLLTGFWVGQNIIAPIIILTWGRKR
jgi:hypothetical protein